MPFTREGSQYKLRMLHVRNPHHTNEWFGRFHDDDWETWNKFPEAMKACNHKVGVKDNGVFWMDWDEFKHGFAHVVVNFDKTHAGKRYTDASPQATKEHQQVEFGPVGHQDWTGF